MHDDGYLDPDFERPWQGSIEGERQEVAAVAEVIKRFVAGMAERRKGRKVEFELLQPGFKNTTEPPSFLHPFRRKQFKRYKNLERILNDLPQRPTFATRDVHRKTHGCLAATFKVRPDLEPDLAKGVFRPGAVYDAVIRFSNGNPKALPDHEPDARGMAVKLLPAGTLPHDDDDPTAVVKQWLGEHQGQQIEPAEINRQGLLDIVTINFPVFFINSPPVYAKVNESFLHLTNDEDALLEKLSDFKAVFFSGMNGWERELALNVNGSIIYHPLYQTYHSMAPSRLGAGNDPQRTAVKYRWEPCRGGRYDELNRLNNPPWADRHEYAHPLRGLREQALVPSEVKRNRNHLRAMIAKSLDPRAFEQDPTLPPVCFELKVQKFIDGTHTPVEDATAIWLDSEAQRAEWLLKHGMPDGEREAVKCRQVTPARTVGTLTISPLPLSQIEPAEDGVAAPQTRNQRCCEDLSFNPWNNVPEEHRPLGIVQRMKREAYAGSRNTRFKENQVPNVFIR